MSRLELDDEIEALDSVMRGYSADAQHAVADIILYNLVIDLREQVGAVRTLLNSQFPRAALANARAAFEGMLDASYVVSEVATYDEHAARLRVFELFEAERIQRRAEVIAIVTPGASMDVEHAVREDAKQADAAFPGQGGLIRKAWEHFSRNPPGVGDHWSGLGRIDFYKALSGPGPDAGEMVKKLDTMYGIMSVGGSHARARSSQRPARLDGDHLQFSTDPRIVSHIEQIAVVSVKLAAAALRRRRAFSPPAT